MEMKRMSVLAGEILPGTLMALMEALTIGLTVMASTIFSKGMSPFVFLVYTNTLSSLFLLPYNSIFYRSRRRDVFEWPFLGRIFVLGLTGVTMAQNLAFVGLSYSSPILVCGMANIIPSISFILSIFFRNTKFDWRCTSSQIRLAGTLVSLIGALSITYYKGPPIKYSNPHQQKLAAKTRLFIFSSTNEHWTLGALYLAAGSLSVALWNIFQAKTMKSYPDEEVMSMASSYTLMGTLQSAVLALLIERDLSVWKLKLNIELFVIVATAIFGSLIRSNVHIWCIQHKGTSYVPMFKPLGIPIASMCGCLFFSTTFHYGSIMGAAICGIGYYTVMWGNIRLQEETSERGRLDTWEENKVPLLEDQV